MINSKLSFGEEMYGLMERLWPICRSITGDGVRQTLSILKENVPEMIIKEIPTGTKCFDWVIPKEWVIRSAYLLNPQGEKVIDFAQNNLHVVNYSAPIDQYIELEDLQKNLHSLPEMPYAIPYVTSYYEENWGFCLADEVRKKLSPGRYKAVIDSELINGHLTYGEIILPGKSDQEIFLSTYVCHPSMANNELSGPCVTIKLAQWLKNLDRFYSYRIIFIPETIGAICYLSMHLQDLKEKMVAGYVLTCIGDEKSWSFMPSRQGDTLSDRTARHVLKHITSNYKEYSFLERGSDERQYCSPGVDLPVSSIMRSKYGTFPEYHTSLDNMEFVSANGLEESLIAYQRIIEVLESDCTPITRVIGEPKMSDRNLRPTLGEIGSYESSRVMMNLLAYADGTKKLLEIAQIIGEPVWELLPLIETLLNYDLIRIE